MQTKACPQYCRAMSALGLMMQVTHLDFQGIRDNDLEGYVGLTAGDYLNTTDAADDACLQVASRFSHKFPLLSLLSLAYLSCILGPCTMGLALEFAFSWQMLWSCA